MILTILLSPQKDLNYRPVFKVWDMPSNSHFQSVFSRMRWYNRSFPVGWAILISIFSPRKKHLTICTGPSLTAWLEWSKMLLVNHTTTMWMKVAWSGSECKNMFMRLLAIMEPIRFSPEIKKKEFRMGLSVYE